MIIYIIEGERFVLKKATINKHSIVGYEENLGKRVFIPLGSVKYIILEEDENE